MNSFVVPTGTVDTTTVRIISDAGMVWRKPTALGGTDPAGFVAYDATEAGSGKYDVATVAIGEGDYLFTMPADVPAGAHQYRGYQAGVAIAFLTVGDVGYWDGIQFAIGFTQSDRAALLAIGAVPASLPATTGSAFDTTGADTAVYWSQSFIGTGQDITGWTRLTFTLKDNPASDDDSDALLTVRLGNPAAVGTDGILIHNRRAVPAADALRVAGIITVEAVNPVQVRATLLPVALQLPPSPDNVPYAFEWDWWDGAGVKRQIGRGEFLLARSVRRGTVAP